MVLLGTGVDWISSLPAVRMYIAENALISKENW